MATFDEKFAAEREAYRRNTAEEISRLEFRGLAVAGCAVLAIVGIALYFLL